MVDGSDPWWEPSMHTKDASLNDGRYWQVVKNLSKVIPHIMIAIFFIDLVIKPVIQADCPWLVISSQKNNFIRIFEFIEKQ